MMVVCECVFVCDVFEYWSAVHINAALLPLITADWVLTGAVLSTVSTEGHTRHCSRRNQQWIDSGPVVSGADRSRRRRRLRVGEILPAGSHWSVTDSVVDHNDVNYDQTRWKYSVTEYLTKSNTNLDFFLLLNWFT